VDGWRAGSFMLKIADNGKNVSEIWRDSDLSISMGDAILLGDRIFGYSYNKRLLRCVDWNTGKELYKDSIKTESIVLISAMNLLYSYDNDANFSLKKALVNGFEKLGSFKVIGGRMQHCSHPVIKNGRLYIRHDNSLFVYNISK
jgi:outer membrane protein assembly factor BamB